MTLELRLLRRSSFPFGVALLAAATNRSTVRPVDPGDARSRKSLGSRKQIGTVGETMEVNVRAIFENCLLYLENGRNSTAAPYDLTGDVVHRVTRCSFPG